MEIVVEKLTPNFQPVAISITLETQQEVDTFINMVGFNTTVQNALFDRNVIKEHQRLPLVKMMFDLHSAIYKVVGRNKQ
jgi:hypothetical protein